MLALKRSLAVLAFLSGILIALKLAPLVVFHFSNPWQLTSDLTQLRFNPFDNIARFGLFIIIPAALVTVVNLITKLPLAKDQPPKTQWPHRWLVVAFLAAAALTALNLPTYHSWGNFDTFHEGEALGAAVSYSQGKVPYRDFIFVHGLIQDPLRPLIANDLFGKYSIGATRTLESATKVAAFITLAVLLLVLFEGELLLALAAFGLVAVLQFLSLRGWPLAVIVMSRDVPTMLFLICGLVLLRNRRFPLSRRDQALAAGLGFTTALSMIYSIDRGYFTLFAYAVVLFLLFWLWPRAQFWRGLVFSVGGGLVGALLLASLLKFDVAGFVSFAVIYMPKFKELMDGFVYPFGSLQFLLPVTIISALSAYIASGAAAIWLNSRQLATAWRKVIGRYSVEILLFALAAAYFRSALGRADAEHVAYSFLPTMVAAAYVGGKYLAARWPQLLAYSKALSAVALGLVLVLAPIRLGQRQLLAQNFPLAQPDSVYEPPNYVKTVDFLKRSLGPGQSFVDFTSEPSWYYFVNKPSPTSFPVVWFAMPTPYQNRMVSEMERSQPPIVIYQNGSWTNTIDGFSSAQRLPIVNRYIQEHYVPLTTIDDNQLLIRRDLDSTKLGS